MDPSPFPATVGLPVAPAPPGSGDHFGLAVELGSMPYAFFKAVEETVPRVLRAGLHGWQVGDCAVTMTHSGYWARQSDAHGTFDKSMSSTAGDVRNLTPLVLMDALRRAGTRVAEPWHAVRLEVPADTAPPVLARLRGVPLAAEARGAVSVVQGQMPVCWRASSCGTRRCRVAPERARTDDDPLDRREYLLRVVRRTGVAAP